MKEIVRASIEDCSQIERFRLVTRLGNAILSNGGEGFRAEQAMGQLLFAAVALARSAGIDPEQALQKCNAAFTTAHADNPES